jgi:hypothetical protein
MSLLFYLLSIQIFAGILMIHYVFTINQKPNTYTKKTNRRKWKVPQNWGI